MPNRNYSSESDKKLLWWERAKIEAAYYVLPKEIPEEYSTVFLMLCRRHGLREKGGVSALVSFVETPTLWMFGGVTDWIAPIRRIEYFLHFVPAKDQSMLFLWDKKGPLISGTPAFDWEKAVWDKYGDGGPQPKQPSGAEVFHI